MSPAGRWGRFWHHDEQADSGHDHGLPGLTTVLSVVALGLAAALVMVFIFFDQRMAALEEYAAGKGVQRDRETAQLNDRFDELVCDVLDEVPPSANLDRLRDRYGCGPGLTQETLP